MATSTGGALGESAWEVRVASRVWGLVRGVGYRGSRTLSGGMHGAGPGEQVESFASRGCRYVLRALRVAFLPRGVVLELGAEGAGRIRPPCTDSYARIPGAPSCIRGRGRASRCT